MGTPTTSSACSTISMARSTPAQKPRGPARTISESGAEAWIGGWWPSVLRIKPQYRRRRAAGASNAAARRASPEEIVDAQIEGARVDTGVDRAGSSVGDVLEPIPDRQRRRVGQDDQHSRAALDQEVHVAVGLREIHLAQQDSRAHVEIGA